MNWICKIIGHKFVGRIVTKINWMESCSRECEPYCKRCGIKLKDIK